MVVERWSMQPERRGRTVGFLRCDVHFADGSRLHFREYVDVAVSINRSTYVYQYMSAVQKLIFRYDNTEHHAHIPTYPHHKHEGREDYVIPSSEPTLGDVLSEIEKIIEAG